MSVLGLARQARHAFAIVAACLMFAVG